MGENNAFCKIPQLHYHNSELVLNQSSAAEFILYLPFYQF